MLNVTDAPSGAVFSAIVKKGEDGRARVILLCDHEKPIEKLAELARDTRKLIEQANHEVAKQCRTLRSRTEEVNAIQLDMDHELTHDLCANFQIKADGNTPYERLRNRAYHGGDVKFAETVHHKYPAQDSGNMEVARWDLAR